MSTTKTYEQFQLVVRTSTALHKIYQNKEYKSMYMTFLNETQNNAVGKCAQVLLDIHPDKFERDVYSFHDQLSSNLSNLEYCRAELLEKLVVKTTDLINWAEKQSEEEYEYMKKIMKQISDLI